MSRKTLWVSIESITVHCNGDVPREKAHAEEQRNAVVATLTYPRSGAPTVSSGKQFNLPDKGVAFQPEQSDFFQCGLFKEEVDDETLLQIKITDTDKVSKCEKIFLGILGALCNAGLTAATEGITGFLGAIAGVGIGQVNTGMQGAGTDVVYVIGATDNIRLKMDELPTSKENPLRMSLGLIVPNDIRKPYFMLDPDTHQTVTEHFELAAGQPNGTITLRVAAVPFGGERVAVPFPSSQPRS